MTKIRFDGSLSNVSNIRARYGGTLENVSEVRVRRADSLRVAWTDDESVEYSLIDDFEDGASTNWSGAAGHATATDTAFRGSASAYRDGGSALRAGGDDFPGAVQRGSEFVSGAVYSGTGASYVSIEFGRDEPTVFENYGIFVDWDENKFRLADRPDGSNWRTLTTTDVSLETDRWYDVVLYWGSDDTLKAWLYDGEVELGTVEALGTGRDGEYWAVWMDDPGSQNLRLDFLRQSETHPYTGQHYEDVEVEADEPEYGEFDITVDPDLMDSVSDEYEVFGSGRYNWELSSDASHNGQQSVRGYIPAGRNWGDNCNVRLPDRGYGQPDELYQRTMFYLDPSWQMRNAENCRIWNAGLNTEAGSGGSGGGGPSGDDGWSTRLYMRGNSSLPTGHYDMLTYTYHLDQPGTYGESEYWGVSVPRGQWHELETYVKLNSVSNGRANYDGIVRCWLNGDLVYERTNFRWRTTESMGHEYTGPVLHYGGGYTSPNDLYLFVDDHQIRIGNRSE